MVAGRVLEEDGRPVGRALVEIWQANAAGRHRHDGDRHRAPLDPNFSGAGRCVTDAQGGFRFVTVKPGAYPWQNHANAWRPAHLHFSLFGRVGSRRPGLGPGLAPGHAGRRTGPGRSLDPDRDRAATRHLTWSDLMDDQRRHDQGMTVRRAVLGDAHVDQATAATTDFTADFQDLITRYAWGDIWSRPGLDRRTRSCITLAILAAMRHDEELAMHVQAALRNGLSADEIKEVLLQVAVYAGVPTANRAFRAAQQALDDSAP